MKLREIRSENFGVFRQRRFDLQAAGLVLVHGPNEAGKSTLLQLLREVLFGFPHSSPYAFEGAGPMAAEAEAVLRDGRTLAFRRRKGRTNTVEGKLDGEAKNIDEQRLAQLLGHASAPLYTHVFAFSLTELAEGVEGLKTAGLTDALFGGGLGGLANLQRVRRELQAAHEELFKPSARERPINKLLTGIKEAKKKLQEAIVKPKEFLEREQALRALADQLADKRAALQAKTKLRDHADRLMRAWQPWRERHSASIALEQFASVPEQIQPGDAVTFNDLILRQREISEELAKLETHIKQLQHEQATLVCEPAIIAHGAEIKTLEQEIGKVEGFLRDLPIRQADFNALQTKIELALRDVHPDWTIEQLNDLRLSLDDRTRMRELIKQHGELQTAIASSAEDVENLQARLARDQSKLATLQEGTDVESIAIALAGHTEFSNQRSAARHAASDEARLRGEMEQLAERLQATLPHPVGDLELLQPPLLSAIEEFRELFADALRDLKQARERLAQQEEQQRQCEGELTRLEATGRIPDSSQLASLRRRRDAGWELIRDHYIQGESRTAEIAAWLSDKSNKLEEAYPRAVADADQLSDERLKMASVVAQKEELLRQQRVAAEAAAKLAAEVTQLTHQHAEIDARWQKLWEPSQVSPQSPSVMAEWLPLLNTYQQKARERQIAVKTQRDCEAVCRDFEEGLRETLGDRTLSIDKLLHSARLKIDNSKQIGGRRQELEQTITENEAALRNARRNGERDTAQLTAWKTAWQTQLTRLQLPGDWQIKAIEQLLIALEQALHDERAATEIKQRIDDMTRERDAFDATSNKLAQTLAKDLVNMPMVERVRQLATRLANAQTAASRQQSLTKEIERTQIDQQAKSKRCEELAATRLAMLQAVGAASDGEFLELAAQAAQRDKLRDEVRAAERALRVAREQSDEAAFEAELRNLDHTAMQLQRDTLQHELLSVSHEIDALQVASGKLQHEMEQLHQEGESLVLQQSIESQRGQLREHVERWSALMLADKMLQNSLETFQREHQPAVLAEARRLFSRMTQGEHIDIRHALGETFWVIDRRGNERRPDQLSRGTREQLYLAFRLAYVQHYCRDSEPLPVVMDDVLVNFDQQRAAQTLAALSELSQELQIIFLTCHGPTVELVMQHCPSCHTIELASQPEPAKV